MSRGPLAATLPLFPRRLQLPIPLGLNLLLMPGEHVLWRDVADGAVPMNVVVVVYVTVNQTARIFERQRRPGPNALCCAGSRTSRERSGRNDRYANAGVAAAVADYGL
jgi:hypothetical protein